MMLLIILIAQRAMSKLNIYVPWTKEGEYQTPLYWFMLYSKTVQDESHMVLAEDLIDPFDQTSGPLLEFCEHSVARKFLWYISLRESKKAGGLQMVHPRQYFNNAEAGSDRPAINRAFDWDSTSEGARFWGLINSRYRDFLTALIEVYGSDLPTSDGSIGLDLLTAKDGPSSASADPYYQEVIRWERSGPHVPSWKDVQNSIKELDRIVDDDDK